MQKNFAKKLHKFCAVYRRRNSQPKELPVTWARVAGSKIKEPSFASFFSKSTEVLLRSVLVAFASFHKLISDWGEGDFFLEQTAKFFL